MKHSLSERQQAYRAKRQGLAAGGPERSPGVETKARKSGKGLIRYWVNGAFGEVTDTSWPPARLIASVQAGLPMGELEELRADLGLPMEKLALLLGISKATLHRRKVAGKLGPIESDRVMRFARLLGMACFVMASKEAGRQWLSSPQVGLGGAVPLEYAETELGAREVERLLGRIEHGVYS